ncbi:MAG TPA: MCE family protein [Acidimicrobiales bacterium]|nr:MCE family protein [Acidimicrobiales bacterium]
MTRRLRWVVVALSVVVALLMASCSVISSGPTYNVRANFSQTIALFPGSFVRELGIDIGSVTKVVNQGDHVQVTMSIKRKYPLRPDASAILVADSVLGERYVQFTPAYVGGPQLAPDSLIPIKQTAVPVETDQVLRSLHTVLSAIDPANAKDLVTNLADIVNGEGAKLNELIGNASGTLQLLADKSNDLGQLTNSLATLTGALRTRTTALASIIQDYDTVSQIVADDRQNVDRTITNLTAATGQAAALLSTNLPGLKDDLSVLTTAGQTLDRNIGSLDVGLANAPKLFSAAKRAYDPQHNWLPLNPALSTATTSAVLAARIRDSLAGVCRRLAVRTPALAPALAACGNVNSGFFNAILNLIPGIIATLPGQTKPAGAAAIAPARVKGAGAAVSAATAAPADAMTAFADGLAAIPGLTAEQRTNLGGAPAASAAAGASSSAPDATAASLASFDPEVALGPRPVLSAAPTRRHHHGLFGAMWSWATGVVGSVL